MPQNPCDKINATGAIDCDRPYSCAHRGIIVLGHKTTSKGLVIGTSGTRQGSEPRLCPQHNASNQSVSVMQLSGTGVTPVPLGTTVPGQTTAAGALVNNPDTTAATLRKGQTAGQIAAANPQSNVFNPTAETAATNPGKTIGIFPNILQPRVLQAILCIP